MAPVHSLAAICAQVRLDDCKPSRHLIGLHRAGILVLFTPIDSDIILPPIQPSRNHTASLQVLLQAHPISSFTYPPAPVLLPLLRDSLRALSTIHLPTIPSCSDLLFCVFVLFSAYFSPFNTYLTTCFASICRFQTTTIRYAIVTMQ